MSTGSDNNPPPTSAVRVVLSVIKQRKESSSLLEAARDVANAMKGMVDSLQSPPPGSSIPDPPPMPGSSIPDPPPMPGSSIPDPPPMPGSIPDPPTMPGSIPDPPTMSGSIPDPPTMPGSIPDPPTMSGSIPDPPTMSGPSSPSSGGKPSTPSTSIEDSTIPGIPITPKPKKLPGLYFRKSNVPLVAFNTGEPTEAQKAAAAFVREHADTIFASGNPASDELLRYNEKLAKLGINDAESVGAKSDQKELNCSFCTMGALLGKTSSEISAQVQSTSGLATPDVTRQEMTVWGNPTGDPGLMEQAAYDWTGQAAGMKSLAKSFASNSGGAFEFVDALKLVAGDDGSMSPEVLDESALMADMKKLPDGTRFSVYMQGTEPSHSHWSYAEKLNGYIVFRDYQQAVKIPAGRSYAEFVTDAAITVDQLPLSPRTGDRLFTKGTFFAIKPTASELEETPETSPSLSSESSETSESSSPESSPTPEPTQPPTSEPVESTATATPETSTPVTTGPVGPGRSAVRQAIREGTLADQLKDPQVRSDVIDWLATVKDPDDEMKSEILAAFDEADKTDNELRTAMFTAAFACELATSDGEGAAKPLPPAALDKVVDTIRALPKSHLPKKWEFQQFEGHKLSGGAWDPDNEVAQIQFGIDDAPDFEQDNLYAAEGDPLEGTKYFESVIQHELGHAVDTRYGGDKLTSTVDGGGWERHGGTLTELLSALSGLVSDFAGALKDALQLSEKPSVETVKTIFLGMKVSDLKEETAFRQSFGQAAESTIGSANIGVLKGVTNWRAKKSAVKDALPMDHLLVQLLIQGSRDQASINIGSDPVAYNGRVYVFDMKYWYSFDRASWNKKMSKYQYAAPGEWFAEFYVAANNPAEMVRSKAQSAYPKAFDWLRDKGMLLHD